MAKILLVEDDNNLREIYEARLQAEGYEIVSARDGEEALTVAMKERPDLIISDVMMPKISGFDMLDIIRSTEETKNSKVIMMTALSQAEDKERATKLGADRYLVKSQVTLEDVAKVAREVLEGEHVAAPAKEDPKPTVDPEESMSPQPTTPVTTTDSATTAPAPTVNDTPADSTDSSDNATPATDPPQASVATDEPTAPTVDPAQAVASSNAPTTAPTPTVAPVAPEPVQTPPDANDEAGSVESLGQSVTQEQDAIAAQIENFIDAKKTGSETAEVSVKAPPENDELKTEPAPVEEPQEESPQHEAPQTTETPKKKVIQPLNDITASKSNDLENLLKKEEEKDQMAQIAKEISSKTPGETVKTEATEELKAEEALQEAKKKLAAEKQPEETAPASPSQVSITEDGKLQNANSQQQVVESIKKPTETPAPATQQTPQEPASSQPTQPAEATAIQPTPAVTQAEQTQQPEAAATNTQQPTTQSNIPHTNGTSIDGVTQPAKPQQSASNQPNTSNSGGLDPNAISL